VQKKKSNPNILFIVSDDLGWDDLGFRSGQIKTPVIDDLAKNGVLLGSYYVQPSCSPSRSCFMSGRYPLHTGINNYIPPQKSYGLPLNETTLADLLLEQGYSTHAIGKWHLGMMTYEYTPTFRGFTSFYGYYSGGEDYFQHTNGGAYDLRRDKEIKCGKNCSHPAVEDYGNYSTLLFTAEGVKIIQEHNISAGPLFLYLAYQAVHAPDQAPQKYIDPYKNIKNSKRRTFAGMLSCMDEGIGNITKALKEKGILEDTFIIFTTDNGGPSETCAVTGTSNWPHRGSKCSIWEGGTRGTALINGPGLKKTGTINNAFMHGVDWLPTLLGMIGVTPKGTLPLDGVNQWEVISSGSGSARSEIYYGVTDTQVGMHGPAFRQYDMKLIVGDGGKPGKWNPPANESTDIDEMLDLVNTDDGFNKFPPLDNTTYLLFNMSSDENEHSDIAKQHDDIVQKLLKRVKEITVTVACMDCPDHRCPDAKKSQKNVTLPNGKVIKAWEPWCDNITVKNSD